eukprot:337023_1
MVSNHIILWDWDDTLYPTTSLIKKRTTYVQNDVQTDIENNLKQLSELLLKLLTIYLSTFGQSNIFIITNGEQNWVLQSLQTAINYCNKYNIENHQFKTIFELILSGKIKTISANYLYSNQYPKQTMLWKYFVFQQIINERFANNDEQCVIVCIGDSFDEYNASKKAISNTTNKNITLHRLKLITKPTIDEINKQFQLIISLVPIFQEQTTNITIDYAKERTKFG